MKNMGLSPHKIYMIFECSVEDGGIVIDEHAHSCFETWVRYPCILKNVGTQQKSWVPGIIKN